MVSLYRKVPSQKPSSYDETGSHEDHNRKERTRVTSAAEYNVTIVVGVRSRGPRWSVVHVHNYFNRTLKKTTTQTNETENVLSGTDTKQKTTIHNSRSKPGSLSMVLNQRQRLTAASDWEPYQAKHIETNKSLPDQPKIET